MIATKRNKVCELPTYKQPVTGATTANVYELKEVKLIPFFPNMKTFTSQDGDGLQIEEEKKEEGHASNSLSATSDS